MSGVTVTRTGTNMTVSWRPLTLVEARGFITGYTVTYTVSAHASRRQTNTVTTGPDVSSATIDGLNADTVYDVSVQASNGAGTSEPAIVPAPPPVVTPVPSPGDLLLAFTTMRAHMYAKIMSKLRQGLENTYQLNINLICQSANKA